MSCKHPLKGYRSKTLNHLGNRQIVFNTQDGYIDRPVPVPCGRCTGCKITRTQQWAIRCIHEAETYNNNCFITLTYNNNHLPNPPSLNQKHFQLFMKRLRKKYSPKTIRFFHAGEYGEQHGRPHYHALLFNHNFDDRKLHKYVNGIPLDRSAQLEKLWPFGYSSVGDVTLQSAAYVARYIMKKINGDLAEDHYTKTTESICDITGEITEHIWQQKPEYNTMSRKPGIATEWFKKYKNDVFPHDYIIHKGQKHRPPKFYDSMFEIDHTEDFKIIQRKRLQKAQKNLAENTPDRLFVKEQIQNKKLELLPRNLNSLELNK